MPNPMIAHGEMNQSKEPYEETKGANEPAAEVYAGENFPYRGIETHGVKPTADPTNMPDWRSDGRLVPVLTVPPNVEIEPVPVRIVNEGSREIKRWRNSTYLVPDTAVQIVGRDRTRTRVLIRNVSTADPIFIGTDSSLTPTFGYVLDFGATLELFSTEEIWAIANPTDSVSLNILVEYSVTES